MFIMASSIQNNRASSSSACVCLLKCKMWCWRAFKWFPVLLIVTILAWSYYAYVIQLCIFTVESTVQQCIYLVLYHILLIMLTWSYWRTIFAEVEPIPDKFKLPEAELEKLLGAESEDAQRQLLDDFAKDLPVVTRTMSGSVRYCNRCVLVKPDRAHHCSICSRCVLKMDHHCPWVNNCVCFHNYKFFVLFLGYALIYCTFIMATCLPYFVQFWKGEFGAAAGPGRYHVVFAFFVSLMFGISLGSLFGYHCYLLVNNRTTLEAFRAPMFRGGADKNGFSLGCYKNFKEVFGHNPNFWILPVFTSAGDGCSYPVRREHEMTAAPAVDAHGYDSMGTTRSSTAPDRGSSGCSMKVHFSDIVTARLHSPSDTSSSGQSKQSEIPIADHRPTTKSSIKKVDPPPRFNPLETFTKKPKRHRVHKHTAGRTGMVLIRPSAPPPYPS